MVRDIEWKAACDNCFCAMGAIRCVPLACAPPLQGCSPIVREGQCCPSTYNCSEFTRVRARVAPRIVFPELIANASGWNCLVFFFRLCRKRQSGKERVNCSRCLARPFHYFDDLPRRYTWRSICIVHRHKSNDDLVLLSPEIFWRK